MRIHLHRIMCSTDFSTMSNATIPFGIALARVFQGQLTVIHVIDRSFATLATYGEVYLDPHEVQQREREHARSALADLQEAHPGEWDAVVAVGSPADEIARQAAADGTDLVIAATHGRAGLKRLLLGSVTERLMRTLPCPFLIVPPDVAHGQEDLPRDPIFRKILVGCDFSDDSRQAFRYGLSLAQEFQAELHLAHVIEPPVYHDLAGTTVGSGEMMRPAASERLTEMIKQQVPAEALDWCQPEAVLLEGRPDDALVNHAKKMDADLIVLGTRGVGLVESLLVGSTTDRVMRRAPCPVLSVKASKAGDAGT